MWGASIGGLSPAIFDVPAMRSLYDVCVLFIGRRQSGAVLRANVCTTAAKSWMGSSFGAVHDLVDHVAKISDGEDMSSLFKRALYVREYGVFVEGGAACVCGVRRRVSSRPYVQLSAGWYRSGAAGGVMTPFRSISEAILHSLLVTSPSPSSCSSPCTAEYVWRVERLQTLPCVLVVALPEASRWGWRRLVLDLGGNSYTLVAIAARSSCHYIARVRDLRYEDRWFTYDDRLGSKQSSAFEVLPPGFRVRALYYVALSSESWLVPCDFTSALDAFTNDQMAGYFQ